MGTSSSHPRAPSAGCSTPYQNPEAPYEHWLSVWPRARGSFVARAGFVQDILLSMRAEAALRAALANGGARRQKLLREAKQLLSSLKKSPAALAQLPLFELLVR